MDKKSKRINRIIALVFFLILFVISALSFRPIFTDNTGELYRKLSDLFVVPGVVGGGVGVLMLFGADGLFDMLSYGVKFFFSRFIHPKKRPQTYYEYKSEKMEKPKSDLHWCFIIPGAICFCISVIFALLYGNG